MHPRLAGGWARRGIASCVLWPSRTTFQPSQYLLDAPVDEGPGAHVLGFLLAPHHISVLIRKQHTAQRVLREGIELLQADDRHVVLLMRATLVQQIVVDLAAADHDATNLLWRFDDVDFRDNEAV